MTSKNTVIKITFFFSVLILQNYLCAMEESHDEPELISCSLHILPHETFEKILFTLIANSENFEEALSSIKCLQCCDKENYSKVDSFVHYPSFIKETIAKLAPLVKKNFIKSDTTAKNIIAKLINTSISKKLIAEEENDDAVICFKHAYKTGYKKISKFFFACSRENEKKDIFFYNCAKINDLEMVRFCLRNGANADVVVENQTALIHAVEKNHNVMVALLLSLGANINISVTNQRRNGIGGEFIDYEETAYSLACKNGNRKILDLLKNKLS